MFLRQTAFWSAFFLNIIFLSRYIPANVLRFKGARRFFLLGVLYIAAGCHYHLYDAFLFVEQEYLFFFYGYFNLNFIFSFLAFFCLLFPWAFLFSALVVSPLNRILPFFGLSAALVLLVFGFDIGFWLPISLFVLAVFLNRSLLDAVSAEIVPFHVGNENWLWYIVGLLALLYYKNSLVLPLILAFFLWHNQSRYGFFRHFKRFCPEDCFFFLFLYFSVVMVFFGNFSIGSSFLLLLFFVIFSSASGSGSGTYDILVVLSVLCLLFFDALRNETFLLLFCYIMLYVRLFRVFYRRKQFTGLALCSFLCLYCLVFRRPALVFAGELSRAAPVLREAAGMKEGRLHGDVYFKSTNVIDDFALFPTKEKWLLFNYFAPADMTLNVKMVFWLQAEMAAHIPGQVYALDSIKTVQAKKKWRLLLERKAARHLGFSFHNIGLISEWIDWLSVLADKRRRVFAVFTKSFYPVHELRRLLLAFEKHFPDSSVLILRDRTILFRGLTPVVEKHFDIHLRPVISLKSLIAVLEGENNFSFAELRDRLIAGQITDILRSSRGFFTEDEAAAFALELYRQGLKKALGDLLAGLLVLNPLNQDYDYFLCLQKGIEDSHSYYQDFRRWLESPDSFRPLRSRDYLVDIFRLQAYFSEEYSKSLVLKHLGPRSNDAWFLLLTYLNENNLSEAAKIVQREALVPMSVHERMLLHRYYMQNLNTRAATFFED